MAVELGRRGGKKRAGKLTPERRQEIGRQGAKARWDKVREEKRKRGMMPP